MVGSPWQVGKCQHQHYLRARSGAGAGEGQRRRLQPEDLEEFPRAKRRGPEGLQPDGFKFGGTSCPA